MVYLNNAATTKPSRRVVKRTAELLEEMWMNPSSAEGTKVKDEIERSRDIIKDILGADEVIFTSGATEGNNAVYNKHKDETIFTSGVEHPSNRFDDVIKGFVDKNGFDLKDFEDAINHTNSKTLVSIMGVNNETGYAFPIKDIGKIITDSDNIFLNYHVDATQMVGHIPINMKDSEINYLTASGHKFGAHKGIGFIAYKSATPIKINVGGNQEHGLRSGTENAIGIITMAGELQYHVDNMDKFFNHACTLQIKMYDSLKTIPDVYFPNDGLQISPYILNICFKNVNGEALVHLLNMKGIAVSSGSACHSGSIKPSYVLKAFEVPDEYIHGSIRISFSSENTLDEIKYAADTIKDCVNILRNIKGGGL